MSTPEQEAAKTEVVGAIRLLIDKHNAATQDPITLELLRFHLGVVEALNQIKAGLTR